LHRDLLICKVYLHKFSHGVSVVYCVFHILVRQIEPYNKQVKSLFAFHFFCETFGIGVFVYCAGYFLAVRKLS